MLPSVATIGFLHTAQVHVATFDALLAELGPRHTAAHIVVPGLLTAARSTGSAAGLRALVRQALLGFGTSPAVVVCTCSTIGGLAENLSDVGFPVLRADRPMAEAAVGEGTVGVVAALKSTLGPTTALLREARTDVRIVEVLIPGAWALFEAGDQAGYLACVAHAVQELAPKVDVVVLAQASMAAAVDLVGSLPVLASPRTAVLRALELVAQP